MNTRTRRALPRGQRPGEVLRRRPRRGRRLVQRAQGRLPHPARALRLRQDHHADEHRRPASDRRRPHQRRRHGLHRAPARHLHAAGKARHRHGVPELRHLAAHDDRAERRLSAGNPQSRARRDRRPRRRRAEARRPGHDGRQAGDATVRRPAAARGAGARHRLAAAPAAVRRAAVQSRSQAARADAHRAQAHPERGRHHLGLRHPRPGRGAGHERRDHRHEQGPDPAARRPARNLCAGRSTPMSATSSASPTC